MIICIKGTWIQKDCSSCTQLLLQQFATRLFLIMRSSIFFAILAATVTSGTYTVSMTELFPYYHNPHSTPLPTVTQVPSRPVAPPSAPVPSPTTPLPKVIITESEQIAILHLFLGCRCSWQRCISGREGEHYLYATYPSWNSEG